MSPRNNDPLIFQPRRQVLSPPDLDCCRHCHRTATRTSSVSGCWEHMGVSENSGTPKSSILIEFSIINHPFWGTPIFGNTHMLDSTYDLEHSTPPPFPGCTVFVDIACNLHGFWHVSTYIQNHQNYKYIHLFSLLRGSFGYLGYVDSDQGFFTSIFVGCMSPNPRVINLQ